MVGISETAEFYATDTVIRDVNAVEPAANIVVGESICLYSRVQGVRDCSADVNNPNIACTTSSGTSYKLVQMDGTVDVTGDSGGGWSWSNTAYGGHKGNCSGSAFSVADYFDEAIGIGVLTQ